MHGHEPNWMFSTMRLAEAVAHTMRRVTGDFTRIHRYKRGYLVERYTGTKWVNA